MRLGSGWVSLGTTMAAALPLLLSLLTCGPPTGPASRCVVAATASAPIGWFPGSIVFDSACRQLLAFGGSIGQGNNLSNATWSWKDGHWTHLMPAHSPPARTRGALAFDAKRNVSVLYGGQLDLNRNPPVAAVDTWIWNGADWHEGRPAHRPDLLLPIATYDASREQVVIVGWDTASHGFATWSWNGEDWQPLMTLPASAAQAGLVYDPRTRSVLLFGGFNQSAGPLQETWSLGQSGWHLLRPATTPQARLDPALGFDPKLKRVLLTGGGTAQQPLMADTWAWDGSNWWQLPAIDCDPPSPRAERLPVQRGHWTAL